MIIKDWFSQIVRLLQSYLHLKVLFFNPEKGFRIHLFWSEVLEDFT